MKKTNKTDLTYQQKQFQVLPNVNKQILLKNIKYFQDFIWKKIQSSLFAMFCMLLYLQWLQ